MKNLKYIILPILLVGLYANNITPIPLHVDDIDKSKARLGKKLFFDPILSRDGTVACVNCHLLELGGSDNLKFSIGIDGQLGSINSPTVLNSRYNFVQFWDGRAKNLKEQVEGPVENPVEMGHSFEKLVKKLKSTKYNKNFKKIYKDGITKENIADAIAEYEKTLITPNAPFDKYLRGDKNAISKKAKRGYELFKKEGCIACHNGVNIGGNLYSKFGFFQEEHGDNLGRYNVTKNPEDKFVFKVPSLRNIEKTAPYLHDGRFETLKEVTQNMMNYQLGRIAKNEDIDSIVEFLKTLNGELIDFEQN